MKNGDRARVAALRAAAERLDCECFLALAEVHETWSCEEDDPPDRYRRGWRFDEEDDESESEDHELIELQDSTISLNHWLDDGGKPVEGIAGTVDGDELHVTKPSRDLHPFKSEHEGYQGNYGNTVDRWYHRAAFLMWPRANTFALRAQASPQWPVSEVLALPRADTSELDSRVKSLLPRWNRTAGSVESAAVAALVDKYGFRWGRELLTEWTKHEQWGTPAWAPLLADLCADLHATKSKACEALARWLLEREVAKALERCVTACERTPPWLDLESFRDEAEDLADVLAARAAISAHQVMTDAVGSLIGSKPSPPLSFLVQLLEECLAREPALKARVVGSVLHRECAERLGAILRAPARAEGDWAITCLLGCACADCKELSRFLRSGRADYDWPLNKERRQHVHRMIDSAQLPVLHTTLRRGSPHVLQLRKDRSLFSRERAYRARVKKILDALPRARSS